MSFRFDLGNAPLILSLNRYNVLLSEVEMWKAEKREWCTSELKLTDPRHPAKAFISKRAEQIKFRSKVILIARFRTYMKY